MPVSPSFWDSGVLSIDPVVTYTMRQPSAPIGLVGAAPELFSGRRSLHFVGFSWNLYAVDPAEIAGELHRMSAVLPDATIVFFANTDTDALLLNNAGVPAIVGNNGMFIDERAYRPLPAFDFSDAAYDAIYNARLEPFKRHELARGIDRLALIYDARGDGGAPPHEAEVRGALSRAHFLNHEYGNGTYTALNKTAIARELNRARCGLCLSSMEGSTRASMEYLLCGIPVVSTHSIGGRDRYYLPHFTVFVPDEAEAVREAIDEVARRKFNKLAVRSQVGAIVEFERMSFLAVVNAFAKEHLGVRQLFETVKPFIEAYLFAHPTNDWSRQRLVAVADALGTALAPIGPGNAGEGDAKELPPT